MEKKYLMHVYKNKGDIQNFTNYRGIKLVSRKNKIIGENTYKS